MIGAILKNHWLSQGLEVNPGVSEEELTAFESKYKVVLPADMREYFLTVNGMAEGVMDNGLFYFWSLKEVKPTEDAESYFMFADFLIWSHAYAIRLSATETANPIFLIGGETPIEMSNSFSEFVSSYLTDPDLLLALDQP